MEYQNGKNLVDSLSSPEFKLSIDFFKNVIKTIWDPASPRIIKDFTDHGEAHILRILDNIANILDSYPDIRMTDRELYLLIAGAYLHDIGMQCDIILYPGIKKGSEKIGAKYIIEFQAKTSNEFSIDEQKEIRKNHHLLSAAWIDHAFNTGETVLGPATKTIHQDLLSDLLDVCKFHSRLPITECPSCFKIHPNERKQLVAAILRFADELDISKNRVNFEVIKSFRLPRENSIYWWLHNQTYVSFKSKNEIVINVMLHPDDKKKYQYIIYDKIINEFQNKNQQTLSILNRNLIPIFFSPDSAIIEDNHSTKFSSDVIEFIERLDDKKSPLVELGEEISLWLEVMNYEISEFIQINDRTLEIKAVFNVGPITDRICVHCIGGEIDDSDIESLDKVLDRTYPNGWLICDQRISPLAFSNAAGFQGIQLFTLSDFLIQKIWRPYFDSLKSLVDKPRINELYVDLSCYKENLNESGEVISQEDHPSVNSYLDQWLKERGKMHISLLGEFGTGKTWFCRHYAYIQLNRFLKDPINERLPLLITLRDFTKTMNAEQLINTVCIEQYNLNFIGSAYDVLKKLNRRGKLLLILDGFDEMARKTDYQTVVDNFWGLAKLVDEKSKVILSSRTEYFRWAQESEKILSGKEYGRNTIVLSPPKFEVLHLKKLSDEQLTETFIKRLGNEKGRAFSKRILKSKNLSEIARKPVLIELLIAAVEEVDEKILTNQSQVYLFATNRLLLRNIATQRTFTTTADKLFFLCELAWEMISNGELKIHYKEIPDRINSFFKISNPDELDNWDFDLRNQSLLHRNAAGYYEFAHKSMAEFFVALKFSAELDCINPAVLSTYSEEGNKPCNLIIKPKNLSELSNTFGEIPFINEQLWGVRSFLNQLLSEDCDNKLWELIKNSKQIKENEIKYVGGNALTLIIDQKKAIRKNELRNVNIRGADLEACNLNGCYFTETDLSESLCCKGNFSYCIFNNASLENVDFEEANLQHSQFSNSNLNFSILDDADFSDSEMSNIDLTGVNAYGTKFFQVIGLERSKSVDRATIVGCHGLTPRQWEFFIRSGAICRVNIDQYDPSIENLVTYLKQNITDEQFSELFSKKIPFTLFRYPIPTKKFGFDKKLNFVFSEKKFKEYSKIEDFILPNFESDKINIKFSPRLKRNYRESQ